MVDIPTESGSQYGADRTAHERSVAMGVVEIAATLRAQLGQALLGVVVDKNVRTLTRWANATVRPPQASEKLLRDTFQVFELLASVDSPEVARAWFMGMNPQLDDASPAEALSEGRSRDVMVAARAYVNAS